MYQCNRKTKQFELYCDVPGCNFSQEFDTRDFYYFLNMAKEDGWKFSVREDKTYTHQCGSCAERGKYAL